MSKSAFSAIKVLDRPKDVKQQVGLGARVSGSTGVGDAVAAIRQSMACPIFNMPVIEQVRWTLSGPQTDQSVRKNFGAEIDLFGSGKSPEGIDYVETTMAQPGQTQTFMIACAIAFHLEPEPLCWTARGNALTRPTSGQAMPISPDVFTQNDVANSTLGLGAGQTLQPAQLEWGWWANYAAWHLVRGYNLRWKIGQHTNILDEVLRHTAYMPPNAQEGSASSSLVDTAAFINRANTRYDDLGANQLFMPINRTRLGSATSGNNNISVFAPTRDFDQVPATYGGMDLRSLLNGNSEFRKLTIPYVIKQGVPIGLILQECDTDQGDVMRSYLSISQSGVNYGGVGPGVVQVASNINTGNDGTGGGVVGDELTLDTPPVLVAQQVQSQRVIFKGGHFKLTLAIKGFEVPEDWYSYMTSNPDIKNAVMSEAGIRFAQ